MSESDWSLYYIKRERRDQMKKGKTENISENEKLKREIELLKAENAYLKKLKALIQEKENKRK
jgi:transposase